MTSFVLAVALASLEYKFDAKTNLDYDVNVVFDGFLPLMGGNEGVADVKFGVLVKGMDADDLGLKSTIELTAFELSFNGGKIPMLDVEAAKAYFPKQTVNTTKLGKVLKSDAPDLKLPVRLPGLDVRRFPDITYLPIELSGKELRFGDGWSFDRMFGDSPMRYECLYAQALEGGLMGIDVKVSQEYEVLEDETLEIVPEEKGAVSRVKTKLTGKGTVIFDTVRGAAVKVDMANSSVSTVTDIKTGKESTRKLDSKLTVKLKGFEMPGTVKAEPKKPEGLVGQTTAFFQGAWNAGKDLWNQGAGYLTLARLGLGVFFSQIPGAGPFVRFITGG